MRRKIFLSIFCFTFAFGLSFTVDPVLAQDTKAKAAKLPRIAINDPAQLKDDKDFPIQGEYEGTYSQGEATAQKAGVQVVARGEGKFMVKLFEGGLPGAGWDLKKPPTDLNALRKEDATTIFMGTKQEQEAGSIVKDTFTLKSDKLNGSFKRVERQSPTLGLKPPAKAVVLFGNAGDESLWTNGKLEELSDGKFLRRGVNSKQTFGSFTAHVEFRLPWMPNSLGQSRGNSGFYIQDRYEIQILDSFGLKGANNECASLYTQLAPSVNMCLPPMVWQTFDIEFAMAEFKGDMKVKPARLTVKHNGVIVQDDVVIKGPTGAGKPEKPTKELLRLQDHRDPVVFRNLWIVEK